MEHRGAIRLCWAIDWNPEIHSRREALRIAPAQAHTGGGELSDITRLIAVEERCIHECHCLIVAGLGCVVAARLQFDSRDEASGCVADGFIKSPHQPEAASGNLVGR